MKRLVSLLFHRVVLVSVMLLLQVGLMVLMIVRFSEHFAQFYFICILASFIVVLHILCDRSNSAYKIAWIIPILIFPLFGGMIYLLLGGYRVGRRNERKLHRMDLRGRIALAEESGDETALAAYNPEAVRPAEFIRSVSGYPVYSGGNAVYFPLGELAYARMLTELKQAQRFIFLEFFIIRPGIMWDSILEILQEKAAAGVDVRVIYDDVGSMFTLPPKYAKKLEAQGVPCRVFNPYLPVLSTRLNNRDHRKLLIVDGNVCFTGGINLADEYINELVRFGHWKDTCVMVEGQSTWSFTMMFLSMWDTMGEGETDCARFRPTVEKRDEPGFLQPFCSQPVDHDHLCENTFVNLMGRAKREIFITTPYLVIDEAMMSALCTAARSGVDVRIITPHIPDKRYVFEMTRAHYTPLMEAGVKIYEYLPGFIHSKTMVVDDEYAIVGTVNLDYRSLFLHFEDGVLMTGCRAVHDVRKDFLETQRRSGQMGVDVIEHPGFPRRMMRSVLRYFAPLM